MHVRRRTGLFLITLTVLGVALSGVAGAASAHAGPGHARPDATVSADGRGDFTSVQAAVDAVPAGNPTPFVIAVRPGTYREQVISPGRQAVHHARRHRAPARPTSSSPTTTPTARRSRTAAPGAPPAAPRSPRRRRLHRPQPDLRQLLRRGRPPGDHQPAGGRRPDPRRPAGLRQRAVPRQPGHPLPEQLRGRRGRPGVLPRLLRRGRRRLHLRPRHRRLRPVRDPLARPRLDHQQRLRHRRRAPTITNPYGLLFTGRRSPATRPPAPSTSAGPGTRATTRTRSARCSSATPARRAHPADAVDRLRRLVSWRDARFAEYRNRGPGALVTADRPQLTAAEAAGSPSRPTWPAPTAGRRRTGRR